MKKTTQNRRTFLKKAASSGGVVVASSILPFHILSAKPRLKETIIGHGEFRYKVERQWSNLDATKHPVKNCHEMVMDQKGRLLMLTDHPQNNLLT